MRRDAALAGLAIAVIAIGGIAAATPARPGGPDGTWRLAEIRTAGIHAGAGAVADDIGGRMTVHDGIATLPGGTRCELQPASAETLRDDMHSFGSGGGTWRALGLVADGDGRYTAVRFGFYCDADYLGLLAQPERDIWLLVAYDGIYFALERAPVR